MPVANNRIIFEGFRTTVRTRDMLLQARAIFYVRTNHLPPRISQGGYNKGGVGASAGTHDKDALDFAVAGWSSYLQKEWELALWIVGFASWWRRFIWNVWPEHNHSIPKKGELSSSAENQEYAFNHCRDGLARNGSYPRIGKYAYRTWESYKKSKKITKKIKIDGKYYPPIQSVSVYWINEARKNKAFSRHVFYVQAWLARLGYYKSAKDGVWGPKTQEALDNFRRKNLKWSVRDSSGPIGLSSLHWLRLKAKSTRLIREGK